MKIILLHFLADEDGAVTVDWVVLTAAIVGLGLLVAAAVKPAALSKTDTIVDVIAATEP